MTIKLSDYLVQFLIAHQVHHIFMVTGGGAMHLNDSIGKEPRLRYICNHHEQACAIAAEGYARVTGQPGVVCVTTGPGGTNAITGVLGQWLDSIPALYLSGQVRYDTTVASTGLPLRQLGDQEANIVEIVKPITKYAVMVTDPQTIRYHLEKAWCLATTGRPGPVWLDIPLNVQVAQVDETQLRSYNPAEEMLPVDRTRLTQQVAEVVRRLQQAERPVLLAGAGIRLAGAYDRLQAVLSALHIPVLVAWDAVDLVASDHPLYCGRPGTVGQRDANFVFQNSDLLLNVGCRLNIRQIGYTFAAVARAAYKISVDIDAAELQKPTFRADLPIQADAGLFLELLAAQLAELPPVSRPEWLAWCRERGRRYPVVLPEYRAQTEWVNPYVFSEMLGNQLRADDVVVSANGAACVVPIQAMPIQQGQRHLVNSGCAGMGYGLPAAIGACFALGGRRVICLEGDGSIQMNLQELQTVVHHQLPLKIFIFNNNGYLSIRTTQTNFFRGHLVGESPSSGVSFPDLVKLAAAYGIPAFRIHNHTELATVLPSVLDLPGPVLCDVLMDPNQLFAPRVASQRLPDGRMVSKPLEDMYPFLEQEEFLSNMIIPPWAPEL